MQWAEMTASTQQTIPEDSGVLSQACTRNNNSISPINSKPLSSMPMGSLYNMYSQNMACKYVCYMHQPYAFIYVNLTHFLHVVMQNILISDDFAAMWLKLAGCFCFLVYQSPLSWTREDVQHWLKRCIEEYSFTDVQIEKFAMNGKLCYNCTNMFSY